MDGADGRLIILFFLLVSARRTVLIRTGEAKMGFPPSAKKAGVR